MRWSLRTLVVVAAITVSACSPVVRSARFVLAPPNPAGHQIRFYSTRLPTCAYEELGLVSAKRRSWSPGNSMDDLLTAAQLRAQEMGGDAIVSLREVPQVTGNGESVSTHESLSGTVIRFKDPGCKE
jgi:hypothetical protein